MVSNVNKFKIVNKMKPADQRDKARSSTDLLSKAFVSDQGIETVHKSNRWADRAFKVTPTNASNLKELPESRAGGNELSNRFYFHRRRIYRTKMAKPFLQSSQGNAEIE